MMLLLNYAIISTALSFVDLYNYFHTHGVVHVTIDKGILRGCNASTWSGMRYFSFKGIPYTKPPIGELRFKGPEEETAWVGVRGAGSHGAVCPHKEFRYEVFRGQEDCLFLNVYTPLLEAERLPVMVWIHGGIFILGSGNDELWGPDYFMEARVVLVTINYRLGALGFLSTEDDNAPGNAGMKDQVAALKWIRRNIAKFGGDPDNVTIFGGSTGAACVHYHLLSPSSSDLFARAISESGSALNPWALSENGAAVTVRLAEALGAENIAGDTARAFQFLKAAPYEDIIRVQESLITAAETRIRIQSLFNPSVEKGVKSEEAFLPDSPLSILESGNYNQFPYITGHTDQEGYFFMNELERPEIIKAAIDDTERYVPSDIKWEEQRNDAARSIPEFYFDDKPIARENISNLVKLYSDSFVISAIKRTVKLHLQSTQSPIYFYDFSYDGGMNLVKHVLKINRPGAVHGDELGYLFYNKFLFWKKPGIGSDDEYVLKTMIRLWTNFAKYGNSTPAGDPLTWKPVTIEKFNYLNISGRNTKLDENPHPERTDFWEKAYEITMHCSIDVWYQQ